ncbi:MAG TPA: universal stress protein [Deltaproteobacteria bacterium]|nr:universal stress protein [Deltaproteobacteria bacterium]
MFETILFPTDFSDVAEKALDFVKRMKDAGTKKVVVLHVIKKQSLEVIAQYSSIRDFHEVEQEIEGDARRELRRIADELRGLGVEVSVRIETGFPVREIMRVEAEEGVSAIVIGSHGLSNVKEILLGSVSESVIRKAVGPVLVVKR